MFDNPFMGRGVLGGVYGGYYTQAPATVATADPWAAIRDAASPGAELMIALGLTGEQAPASLWFFETSNTVGTDKVGAVNLAGTGLTATTDAKLGGTCIQWDSETTDTMAASANTVYDRTTGAVAMLWVGVITSAPVGAAYLCGKRTFASSGYTLRASSTGALNSNLRAGATQSDLATSLLTYNDGNAIVAMFGRDTGRANENFVVTDREARAEANFDIGNDMTNTNLFAFGTSGASLNSAGQHVRLGAIWTTLPATTISRTHCQNLKTYLGI